MQNRIKIFELGPEMLNEIMQYLLFHLYFQLIGGELGGKNPYVRWGSSIFLVSLWCLYIILASLKAYDVLVWDI